MTRPQGQSITTEADKDFVSSPLEIKDRFDISHKLDLALEELKKFFEEYIKHGSGWKLEHVVNTKVNFAYYEVIAGSKYQETPVNLYAKHCCINPKNDDEKCFQWCLLIDLFQPKENARYINQYMKYIDPNHRLYDERLDPKFIWEEKETGRKINFPVRVTDLALFEKLNPRYAINVWGWEEPKPKQKWNNQEEFSEDEEEDDENNMYLRSFRASPHHNEPGRDRPVNLIMLGNEDIGWHYIYVNGLTGLQRLMGQQGSLKKWYCPYDQHWFTTEQTIK
jgi:hypothetical protein